MGAGLQKKCPKCGYTIDFSEGVGFLYPTIYDETVQKAKDGELGEDLQTFFKEHEDGMINAENVTLCCEDCGYLTMDKDLTMYVPGDAKDVEGDKYIPMLIPSNYEVYSRYTHKCEKCDGKMKRVSMYDQLLCPKCKTPLEDEMEIMWD